MLDDIEFFKTSIFLTSVEYGFPQMRCDSLTDGQSAAASTFPTPLTPHYATSNREYDLPSSFTHTSPHHAGLFSIMTGSREVRTLLSRRRCPADTTRRAIRLCRSTVPRLFPMFQNSALRGPFKERHAGRQRAIYVSPLRFVRRLHDFFSLQFVLPVDRGPYGGPHIRWAANLGRPGHGRRRMMHTKHFHDFIACADILFPMCMVRKTANH